MNQNHGKIKATQHDIVFISPSPCANQVQVTRWLPDPDADCGKFLQDCSRNGWPYFRGPDGTAFVYATGGLGR
jgi:hypothetical protein